jgi:leader peptidase (prepilin peptidase)/N-methyltransferase
MIEILMFFLGAVFASFVGVVAMRFHTGLPILRGRSRCLSCGVTLSSPLLVPVFSYIFTKGRCRSCGTRIPLLLPIVEAGTGIVFVALFLMHGPTPLFFVFLLYVLVLLFLFLYDLSHMLLPVEALYGSVAVSLAILFLSDESLLLVLVGSSAIALFLYAIHFFSKGRALGFGDVILVFSLSLAVGAPAMWIGLLLSFWLGAGIGIIVLLTRYGGARMGVAIPFGPFLILGFLCAYILEEPLLLLARTLGVFP